MTTETPSIDRRIRIPIAGAVVLVGVIAQILIDMIAEGELSQWTGNRKWEPFGIFAVYYPMLMAIFRWLVPALGLGTAVVACRRQIRADHFVWCLCAFIVVATICVSFGVLMVYGLFSVTHHVLGG